MGNDHKKMLVISWVHERDHIFTSFHVENYSGRCRGGFGRLNYFRRRLALVFDAAVVDPANDLELRRLCYVEQQRRVAPALGLEAVLEDELHHLPPTAAA